MDRMMIIDKKTGKTKYLVDEENRVIDLEKKDVEVDRKEPIPRPRKKTMPENPNKQFDSNFEGGRTERDRSAELAQRTPAQRRAQLEQRQDEPGRCKACGSPWCRDWGCPIPAEDV